jgi:hypothetical protein
MKDAAAAEGSAVTITVVVSEHKPINALLAAAFRTCAKRQCIKNPPLRAEFPLHTESKDPRIPVAELAVVEHVHTVRRAAVYRLVVAGVGWLMVVALVKAAPGDAGDVGAVVEDVGATYVFRTCPKDGDFGIVGRNSLYLGSLPNPLDNICSSIFPISTSSNME